MRTRTLFNSFSKKRKRNLRRIFKKNRLTSGQLSYLKFSDLLESIGDKKLRTIKPKFLIITKSAKSKQIFCLEKLIEID